MVVNKGPKEGKKETTGYGLQDTGYSRKVQDRTKQQRGINLHMILNKGLKAHNKPHARARIEEHIAPLHI